MQDILSSAGSLVKAKCWLSWIFPICQKGRKYAEMVTCLLCGYVTLALLPDTTELDLSIYFLDRCLQCHEDLLLYEELMGRPIGLNVFSNNGLSVLHFDDIRYTVVGGNEKLGNTISGFHRCSDLDFQNNFKVYGAIFDNAAFVMRGNKLVTNNSFSEYYEFIFSMELY